MIDYVFNLPMEAASVFLYLFFALLYSSSLPILMLLTLFIMTSQYVANKIVIGKYSRQVSANEDINEKFVKYLPWAILVHVLFSMWTYTCPDIFPGELFSRIRVNIKYFGSELDRIFNVSYLLGLAVVILGGILFDLLIIRSLVWLAECCGGE